MLQRLWDAFRYDRWLQIATLAFIVLFTGFQERLTEREQMQVAVKKMQRDIGQLDFDPNVRQHSPANQDSTGHSTFNLDDEGPFIVELPAPREMTMQSLIALLSGREVHVKDENGDWRILEPVTRADGRVEDHSETLLMMARTGCAADAPPHLRDALYENFSPSDRRVFCALAAQE
jgi:hypothetical protein